MLRFSLFMLLVLALTTSCAESYHIVGSTAIEGGRHVQLRQRMPAVAIAQANIIHGRFELEGIFDSVAIVDLYVDGQHIIPIVIERELCSIHIAPTEQQVTGGLLNTKLSNFIKKKRHLYHRIAVLREKLNTLEIQGLYDTPDYHSYTYDINRLLRQLQDLQVTFVVKNQTNILGPYYFASILSSHCDLHDNQMPLLRQILRKTSPHFRNLPAVAQVIVSNPELRLIPSQQP
ncbi:MAG: DUF4369 domain-containing protein [Bacteroidales bacterium]|nr:DUF4369 domain-containing protein [Bacteroidales bacterium]